MKAKLHRKKDGAVVLRLTGVPQGKGITFITNDGNGKERVFLEGAQPNWAGFVDSDALSDEDMAFIRGERVEFFIEEEVETSLKEGDSEWLEILGGALQRNSKEALLVIGLLLAAFAIFMVMS